MTKYLANLYTSTHTARGRASIHMTALCGAGIRGREW